MLHRRHPPGSRRERLRLAAALAAGALAGYAAGTAHTARLRHQATHDPLTGLPNRRAALAELAKRLRAGTPTLLALVDLDEFKTVNDTYGHDTGDRLLREAAHRLHRAAGRHGLAARLGGDEFLLLLPTPDDDPAGAVEAILTRLAQPVHDGHATLRPHATAGVTTSHHHRDSDSGALLRAADAAMYQAKRAGTRVAVHHPDRDDTAIEPAVRPRVRRRDRHPAVDPDTAPAG